MMCCLKRLNRAVTVKAAMTISHYPVLHSATDIIAIPKMELAKHDMRQQKQPESESESYLPSDPIIDGQKLSDSNEPIDYEIYSNHASILGQADKNSQSMRHALFHLRNYGH